MICVVDPAADALSGEDSWAWHSAVATKVVESGEAWISPVRLAGRAALRMCLTSHLTGADDLTTLVDELDAARHAVGTPG
ncbi:hypothetical protein [Streptomyces kanamyceticus]|uniref:Uncharacterized protein n=1 Tax=Streptomyces kanamyceticus TaxID=1967 RepID=A0A5J6G8J1_STRKN|nr:hypothetical protein [Streptomyces kanamyceticus]QEU90101.1 hypothetical protein CP970_03525 [Streptomyces kanamyceticus]